VRQAAVVSQRGGDGAEAVSALVNLGYKQAEAERAVAGAEQAGPQPLEDVIREALRRLAS
jgi:Holliday junction resolvasome RuvABC DNA-binding subunit